MTRTLTTSRLYNKKSTVPYIRLRGQWLRDAGIQPKDRVQVVVTTHGQITITKQEVTS